MGNTNRKPLPVRFKVADMDKIVSCRCPCGQTRRAFLDDPDRTASFHIVTIQKDSRIHYHKKTTEIYYILKGEGHLELDGKKIPARAGTAVLIKPGCRHRAVGEIRLINVPVPALDTEDEWFD